MTNGQMQTQVFRSLLADVQLAVRLAIVDCSCIHFAAKLQLTLLQMERPNNLAYLTLLFR